MPPSFVSSRTPAILTPPSPYSAIPFRADLTRPGGSPESFPPLVLVVDDHDDSRTIERLVLESVGFRVAEARTGREGLRVAADQRPAVVLLDMVLPEIDGWEIARQLRCDPETRNAVIIAVTALASHDDHDRAILAGCDEVLTKPVPPTSLLGTVKRYVGFPLASGLRIG
jgi:CheY-like chemotaxis protein